MGFKAESGADTPSHEIMTGCGLDAKLVESSIYLNIYIFVQWFYNLLQRMNMELDTTKSIFN